jgi:hypothetical protein
VKAFKIPSSLRLCACVKICCGGHIGNDKSTQFLSDLILKVRGPEKIIISL